MMWPMPGVANSTIKCPNFGDFVWAMALRPEAVILFSPNFMSAPGGSAVHALFLRSLEDEVTGNHRFLRHQMVAGRLEGGEMRRLQMLLEGGAVVVDLVEQDAVGIV